MAPTLKLDLSVLHRPGYPESPVYMPGQVELKPFCFDVKRIYFDKGVFRHQHAYDAHYGRIIRLDVMIRDRNDPFGAPLPLTFAHPHTFATDHEAARDLLLRALRHEVDECLLVNGVRVNDPHANGRQGI